MADLPIWPPASPLCGREASIQYIVSAAADGHCSSLVGMSNVGKSYALRALCREAEPGQAAGCAFVYVDCNRMVEATDQGFYELILRCMKAVPAPGSGAGGLSQHLEQCYADVVAPASPFLAHLRFSEAISAWCEGSTCRLALVLDEFDEVMAGIDDRVLLNLRALRDTYPHRLSYVTATRRRLGALRHSHGAEEFAELFVQNTHFLAPLGADAAAALVGQWTQADGLHLEPKDMPVIFEESGGHPALLEAVAQVLSALRQEAQAIQRPLSAAQIREQLDSDVACQTECAKFWEEADQDERHALLDLEAGGAPQRQEAQQALAERHLLRRTDEGPRPFCRLLATFVRRQRIARQPDYRGVRVDVEAGDVWVDGRPIPALTESEYRLLLLLYGHLDKIVDKYAVVEAVWGQDYIDQVDDARIEKLVSRLRQKLEADPTQPRYLLTVRGRGYRLVSP